MCRYLTQLIKVRKQILPSIRRQKFVSSASGLYCQPDFCGRPRAHPPRTWSRPPQEAAPSYADTCGNIGNYKGKNLPWDTWSAPNCSTERKLFGFNTWLPLLEKANFPQTPLFPCNRSPWGKQTPGWSISDFAWALSLPWGIAPLRAAWLLDYFSQLHLT